MSPHHFNDDSNWARLIDGRRTYEQGEESFGLLLLMDRNPRRGRGFIITKFVHPQNLNYQTTSNLLWILIF